MLKSSICLTFLVIWLIIGFAIDEILIISGKTQEGVDFFVAGAEYTAKCEITYKAESYDMVGSGKIEVSTSISLFGNNLSPDPYEADWDSKDTYKKGYKESCKSTVIEQVWPDYEDEKDEKCKALKSMADNGDLYTSLLSICVLVFFLAALFSWLTFFGKCTRKCQCVGSSKIIIEITILVALIILGACVYILYEDWQKNIDDASDILLAYAAAKEADDDFAAIVFPGTVVEFDKAEFGYTSYIIFLQIVLGSIAMCIVGAEDARKIKTKQERQLEMYTGR